MSNPMSIKVDTNQTFPLRSQNEARHKPDQVNFIRTGTGEPVILIHGLAASLKDWETLLPELAESGFDACALDLLGHGESYKPQLVADYNVHNVYAHLQGWIDTLYPDEPTFLVGHSLGGYLALVHALRNPHKVKGLILVNPYYSIRQMSAFLQMVFKRQLLNTALIEKTPYWLFRIVIDISSFEQWYIKTPRHRMPEEVRRQTALDYKRAAPGIYNIPRTMTELGEPIRTLEVPTLVIGGTQDRTLDPRSFSELVSLLPNASYIPLANSAHVPHQSDGEIFNPLVLKFLNEHK